MSTAAESERVGAGDGGGAGASGHTLSFAAARSPRKKKKKTTTTMPHACPSCGRTAAPPALPDQPAQGLPARRVVRVVRVWVM